MKRIGPLPSSHRFPGGFTLDIQLAERQDDNLDEPGTLGPDMKGRYDTLDVDHGLITIWAQATPLQKWIALMHEMVHAVVDAQNWVEVKWK